MKTAARLLATLLLGLPTALLAQDERARAGHHHCFAFTQDQSTYYTTVTWDGTFFLHEVSNAFSQELLTRYGYKDRVSCSRADMAGSTLAKITTDFQNQAAQWRARGAKVVQVPWTYNPATAKLPHLCWAFAVVQADGKRTNYQYVNQIIQLPGGTMGEASMAFDAHMKTLRPGAYFVVPGGCTLLPPDPEGQQRTVDGTLAMYQSQKAEVIRLQWNYVAQSAAEAAATKATDDTPAVYCEMVGQMNKEWFGTPTFAVDPAWKWEDYTRAWRRYALTTLKLDLDLYRGACELGTMKTQTRARAVRKEGFSGQGWSKLHDVDWKYAP